MNVQKPDNVQKILIAVTAKFSEVIDFCLITTYNLTIGDVCCKCCSGRALRTAQNLFSVNGAELALSCRQSLAGRDCR